MDHKNLIRLCEMRLCSVKGLWHEISQNQIISISTQINSNQLKYTQIYSNLLKSTQIYSQPNMVFMKVLQHRFFHLFYVFFQEFSRGYMYVSFCSLLVHVFIVFKWIKSNPATLSPKGTVGMTAVDWGPERVIQLSMGSIRLWPSVNADWQSQWIAADVWTACRTDGLDVPMDGQTKRGYNQNIRHSMVWLCLITATVLNPFEFLCCWYDGQFLSGSLADFWLVFLKHHY